MKQGAPIKPTTIAMADDHTLLRNALAQVIEGLGNYRVVVQAANGRELLDKLKEIECPDLLLLDINMPEMNGIETAKEVSRQYPGIKIIALSMMEDELMLVRMIINGARGIILKDAEPFQLKEVLENVLKTGYHFNELNKGRLIYSLKQNIDDPGNAVPELSEIEGRLCELACTEKTDMEIVRELGVKIQDLNGYRISFYEKLGLKTRTGLALYAAMARMANIF